VNRRVKDVRVWSAQKSWHDTVSAAEVMVIRHLHADHGLSVREINKRVGMSDRLVRAALDSGSSDQP
jgi:transposase